jgi:hypothetical protein
LKAMMPNLDTDPSVLPRGSIDLGDQYILLRAMDNASRSVRDCEAEAITSFAESEGVDLPDGWRPSVIRWARLRIPNEQVVRSAWKENTMTNPRISRMVKVCLCYCFRILLN